MVDSKFGEAYIVEEIKGFEGISKQVEQNQWIADPDNTPYSKNLDYLR